MRLSILLCTVSAVILTSCAYQGVIVQKDATPLPFTHSVGVEGSYAFLLRDNAGIVRRQIVTPDVYNQYAIGEYFNDMQPAPTRGDAAIDSKVVQTAMVTKAQAPTQLARAGTTATTPELAAKPVTKPVTVAAISTPAKAKTAPAAAKLPLVAAKPAAVSIKAPVVTTAKTPAVAVASMTAVAKPAAAAPKSAPTVAKPTSTSSKPAAVAASMATAPAAPKVAAVATKPTDGNGQAKPAASTAAPAPAVAAPVAATSSVVASTPPQQPATMAAASPYRRPTKTTKEPGVGFIVVARCR